MAQIAALLDSPASRQRLQSAALVDGTIGVRHCLTFAADRAELIRELRRAPHSVVVLDPYHRQELQDSLVSWCIRNNTTRSVLLYGDFSGRPAADTVRLARMGVRWILTLDVDDDVQSLRRALVGATNDLQSRQFLSSVRALVPPSVYPIAEHAYYACLRPLTVSELARSFVCSDRHLHRQLTAASLPAPGRLIHWFRIIHAARLLDDRGRSINQVADVLGFSDPANLRRLFRSLLGVSPLEVRQRGGVVVLQTAFLALISPLGFRADRTLYLVS